MAKISTKIEYAKIDDLMLDPLNPRLGRDVAHPKLLQEKALDAMRDWSLEELAESFISNGFWPQEAVIAVKEKLYGKTEYVVVEGNRRIAALKYLKQSVDGDFSNRKWANLIEGKKIDDELFNSVPFILIKSRQDVSAYLGFRHVTGIKEWHPAEKAQYIANLIEKEGLSYDDVRKKIGSRTPTVRLNYIAYKLLLQIEDQPSIDNEKIEDRFSVLYLSLRTEGVQKYLNIDVKADADKAKKPVPESHIVNLTYFARWLFGDKQNRSLFSDSRSVDEFGKVLESSQAVQYLERTEKPNFELALRKSGVGELEIERLIIGASDNIQIALTDVHVYKTSDAIRDAIKRLSLDYSALLSHFPNISEK